MLWFMFTIITGVYSMQYLNGVTFPAQSLTPSEWGYLFEKLLPDGVVKGCTVTSSGTNLYIAKGALVVKGRLIDIPSTLTEATSPTYANGFGRAKIVIDTTQTSTSSTNHQTKLVVEYSSTRTFPALTQQDINGTGTIYEAELAILDYSNGSIASVDQKLVSSDIAGTLVNLTNAVASLTSALAGKQKQILDGTEDPAGLEEGDIYIKWEE